MNFLEELDSHMNSIDHELEEMINNYLPIEFVNENKRLHKERDIIISLVRKDPSNFKFMVKLRKNTEDFILFQRNVLEYVQSLP